MSIVLATLCLNEMEWLPKLYEQHKDWPEMIRWIFVEAADTAYAKINNDMVGPQGLSVDGTSTFLQELERKDPRVTYIPHGFADHPDRALGKIGARDRYLQIANDLKPEFVISVDADEFYMKEDQSCLIQWMREHKDAWSFTFPRTEIWRPPSCLKDPLFSREVVGGFWGIPCSHWWRWKPGMMYRSCHNTPQAPDGTYFNEYMVQFHHDREAPAMIHMGYAASEKTRVAKNMYYERRGEIKDPGRKWYTHSRSAWKKWTPGTRLPDGAKVRNYEGPIPECFR